jgi:hypothetical protein
MNKVQEHHESSDEPNLNEGGVARESEERNKEVELSPDILQGEINKKGSNKDLNLITKKGSNRNLDLAVNIPGAYEALPEDSPSKTPDTGISPSKIPDTATKFEDSPTKTELSSSKRKSFQEPAKNHKKSYFLALGASICLGMANYFMSDLSIRKGLKGIPCQMFGFLLTWTLYYVYRLVMH